MRSPTPTSMRRGSALLAVLWIVALLTMLVGTTTLLLREDVETAATRRQMFRARMLAEQGLAIACHPDVRQDDEELLRHQVEPNVGWIVEMEGEDGRINPNKLIEARDRITLGRIFTAWGLKSDEREKLIDAMFDWVDPDDFTSGLGGAESKFYNTRGYPFNRAFRTVDEMAMVRYMDAVERIYPNWRSWFSIYASGTIDVNEASAEVLSAITGANMVNASSVVARRVGPDGKLHTKDDAMFQDVQSAMLALGVSLSGGATPPGQGAPGILGVQSAITRIKSTGVTPDFRRTIYAIVNRPTSPMQGGGAGGGATSILWLGEEDERAGAAQPTRR